MKASSETACLALLLALLWVCQDLTETAQVKKVFGKFGSVKIDFENRGRGWSQSWPEGIRLVNNFHPKTVFPRLVRLSNTSEVTAAGERAGLNYPYTTATTTTTAMGPPASSSRTTASTAVAATAAKPPFRSAPRRTFSWQGDYLVISVDLEGPLSRPPLPFALLAQQGARIRIIPHSVVEEPSEIPPPTMPPSSSSSSQRQRVDLEVLQRQVEAFHTRRALTKSRLSAPSGPTSSLPPSAAGASPDTVLGSVVEITVTKQRAEEVLSVLRGGTIVMAQEALFRMIEKAPWLLALPPNAILLAMQRLREDLLTERGEGGLNSTEVVHILGHCPHLLVQYLRYPGKDVSATIQTLEHLLGGGKVVKEYLLRFPSLLCASAGRLRAWQALCEYYGVGRASQGGMGGLLKRASFMYYIDPPHLLNGYQAPTEEEEEGKWGDGSPWTRSATEEVLTSAQDVLHYLAHTLRLKDVDKVVRTDPFLLTQPLSRLQERVELYLVLLRVADHCSRTASDTTDAVATTTSSSSSSSSSKYGYPTPRYSLRAALQTFYEEVLHRSERPAASHSPRLQDEEKGLPRSEDERRRLEGLVLSDPNILALSLHSLVECLHYLDYQGVDASTLLAVLRAAPQTFARPLGEVQAVLHFLGTHLGLSSAQEVRLTLRRYPQLLTASLGDLGQKLDYFRRRLRGSAALLRRHPNYLLASFDRVILPRTEFLRAMGKDPLLAGGEGGGGLACLLTTKDSDFVQLVGSDLATYRLFQQAIQTHLARTTISSSNFNNGYPSTGQKRKATAHQKKTAKTD